MPAGTTLPKTPDASPASEAILQAQRYCIPRSLQIWLSVLCVGAGLIPARLTAQTEQYPGKYIIASLVLPGAGELWRGQRAKGEFFLWVDGAIWLTYGTMHAIGGSRNHAAKLFASRFSGSSTTQRSDEYYVAVERYPNSDLYNEDIRREARELYPDDPERQKAYAASHGYSGAVAWNWGSDSLRFAYWRQRKGARSILHTAGFVLGAAFLNRLASAIDVAFFSPPGKDKRLGIALTTEDKGSRIRGFQGSRALDPLTPRLLDPSRSVGLALVWRF